MRRFMVAVFVGLSVLGMGMLVWAQGTPTPPMPPPESSWGLILATAINTVGVMLILKGVASVMPWLREQVPVLLPILAGAIGPAVAALQTALAEKLGVPIDLSPLVGIFSGGSSIALAQVFIQRRRMRAVHKVVGSGAKLAHDGAPI